MQSNNKNKLNRNSKISEIRSKLKFNPVLHSTTDRIQALISQNKKIQQKIQNKTTDFEDLCQSNVKRNQNSQHPKDFENKYTVGKKIGEGAHGYVKQCFHKQSGNKYALKIIPSDKEFFFYLKRNFVNIVELDHPNIIKYKAFYFDMKKETCLLVMEYLPFPTLNDINIQNQEELKRIIYGIIEGLEYIHKKHIIHRDIKPENILYDQNAKKTILIDFGCSCKYYERGISKQMLSMTGTPQYRAPQMFTGGGYDQRIDLWALGCLIFKLVQKVTPFQSQYHSDTINNIVKGEVIFNNQKWNSYSHLLKDLISHLLKPKESRLTIKQAKNHFWFQTVKKDFESDLIKSVGFEGIFALKRTITQFRTSVTVKSNLSPVIKPLNTPKMFSLEKYQDEQKKLRWLNLEQMNQMDLIESEDEQSALSPSPRLPKNKNGKM